MSLLPSGYPPGACTPQTQPMPGSVVSVKCTQNTDANGPTVAAYGLFADVAALKSAFTGFIGTFTVASCPGGKASPGNWWHTQDPNTVLGQLACGTYKDNEPQVMWSNEQTLVFGLVAGKPQGPKPRSTVQVVGFALMSTHEHAPPPPPPSGSNASGSWADAPEAMHGRQDRDVTTNPSRLELRAGGRTWHATATASGLSGGPPKPISIWTIRGCRETTRCWSPRRRGGFWSTTAATGRSWAGSGWSA